MQKVKERGGKKKVGKCGHEFGWFIAARKITCVSSVTSIAVTLLWVTACPTWWKQAPTGRRGSSAFFFFPKVIFKALPLCFPPMKTSPWLPPLSHFPAVVSPHVITSQSTALITVQSGRAVKHGRTDSWAQHTPFIFLYQQTDSHTHSICIDRDIQLCNHAHTHTIHRGARLLCSNGFPPVFLRNLKHALAEVGGRICQSMSDPPNPQVGQEL